MRTKQGLLKQGLTAVVLTAALGLSVHAKPAKPVLGFYTSWAPPSVQYSKITHLMYAFIEPSGGGQLSGSVPGNIISEAHNAGVKVIASIGGANHSGPFPSLAASASGRSAFANGCKALVNSGVDGVDIDWEYPANATDSTNLTLLVAEIRKAIGAGKLITMDMAPTHEKGKWFSTASIKAVDFVNVMAYDFTGSFSPTPGQHSSYNHALLGVTYWRNRGVPKERVIMGVPFYGKNFNAGGSPVDYRDIMSQNPGLSPDADSVGKTWFNGVTTIKKKATYVAQNSYGGVMIWQLGGDASGNKSLLDAIQEGLQAEPISIVSRSRPGKGGFAGLSILPAGSPARMFDFAGRRASTSIRPAAGAYFVEGDAQIGNSR